MSPTGQHPLDQIEVKEKVEIGVHLYQFKKASNFQSGVTSLLANLRLEQEELNRLRLVFLALDTDKNGQLSLQELEDSMDHIKKVFVRLLGRMPNWKSLVHSIDADSNG